MTISPLPGDDPFRDFKDEQIYDKHRFYPDLKGPKESVTVKLPASMVAQIGEILADRRFPDLKTISDWIRNACFHEMQKETHDFTVSPAVKQMWELITRDAKLEQEGAEMDAQENLVNDFAARMKKAADIKDQQKLDGLIRIAIQSAQDTREPYKSRWIALVKEHRPNWDEGM